MSNLTPLKAIRKNCIECCNSTWEVKLCPSEHCPLYSFRLGKNPFKKKREYTPEQLKALSDRGKALARARASQT